MIPLTWYSVFFHRYMPRSGVQNRWKALFGSGLEASDDFSDSASQASIGSVATRASTRAGRGKNAPRVSPSVASTVKSKDTTKTKTVASRPVSVLKPKVGEEEEEVQVKE